jgi:hypothetical protein
VDDGHKIMFLFTYFGYIGLTSLLMSIRVENL